MATTDANGRPSSPKRPPRGPAKTTAKDQVGLADILADTPTPADAAGRARAEGLGVSPAVDAWLGLGFPRVVLATDEPMEPCATVADFQVRYPIDAYRLPRAAVAMQYALYMSPTPVDPAGPLPTIERIDLARAARDVLRYGNGRVLQQLEVLCGTVEVAEATVDAIVQAADDPAAVGKFERGGPAVVRAGLAWLLWRVPGAVRERHRAALEAAWAGGIQNAWNLRGSLDVMLHGRAGVERSGNNFNGRLHLGDLVFAEDDPCWARDVALARLATLRPADRERFDPQLVVLCGREVLESFRAGEAKFQRQFRPAMRAELALFR